MTPVLQRLVKQYDRGAITAHELATRVVEATTERLTAEFVASLPAMTLDSIQACASEPPGTKWLRVTGANCIDGDLWAAQQQELAQRWNEGIVFWREYFGFNAEEKP
jgi:hypothetical protein